jgi:hypothetical protein
VVELSPRQTIRFAVGGRCLIVEWRFALVGDDGVVTHIRCEFDGSRCSGARLPLIIDAGVHAICLLSRGRIAIASDSGEIAVLNLRNGSRFGPGIHMGSANCVAGDGLNVVSGGADTFTCIWGLGAIGEPKRISS